MEKEVLWMARDRDGSLYVYRMRLEKTFNAWYIKDRRAIRTSVPDFYQLPAWLCPEVSWDEDEPRLVNDINVTFIRGRHEDKVQAGD